MSIDLVKMYFNAGGLSGRVQGAPLLDVSITLACRGVLVQCEEVQLRAADTLAS